MSDQNTVDNWRLEESGKTRSQWTLEETEQNRLSQWELQDEYQEEVAWQPVEYERDVNSRQGGGWVLPSLVGLALLAVVAYGAWIGLTRLPSNMIGSWLPIANVATPTSAAESVAATGQTADTPTPTVAVITEQPTATPEPTLPPAATPTVAVPVPLLVEQQFVVISAQYGVNARPEPSTEGDAIEILEQGEEFLVIDTQEDWLQIMLPFVDQPSQLVWISADPQFVTLRSEEVDLATANARRAQAGMPPLEENAGLPTTPSEGDTEIALAPTPTPEEEPVIEDGTVPTDTTAIFIPAPDDPPVAEVEVAGTVNIAAGLNARRTPDTNGELVALLENSSSLSFTGRTADSTWLRTALENGDTVWVFAEFITIAGDVATLPVVVTDSVAPPDTAETPDEATSVSATASVTSLLGAGIREAPDPTAVAISTAVYDNVLTVTGRSEDNQWLQIDLDGQPGWVSIAAVELSVDIETLPVVVP